MREELSKHATYEEAKKAYSKHDVQDDLQIRRVSGGFKVVRRSVGVKETQGPGKRGKRGRQANA